MEPQVMTVSNSSDDIYFNNTTDEMWVTSTLTASPNTILDVNKFPDISAIMPSPQPLTPQQMQELTEEVFKLIKAEKLGIKFLETEHEEKRLIINHVVY